jgi:hypothetical protein
VAAAVLVPSLWGFGGKFLELVRVAGADADGAFAIAPIANYVLASAGFALLFLWAAARGMLRDIEGPKWTLLENESLLDRAAETTLGGPPR